MKIFRFFIVLLSVSAILGCAESSLPVPTGEGKIRALNAAVTAPDLVFKIEERVVGVAPYKLSTISRELDDLPFTVNFDFRFAGDLEETRILSVPFKLVKDSEFLFIFTGSLANPDALTWESPIRKWDGSETTFEIGFGHLSPQLGEVDMYFAALGTVPVLGEAVATLSNGNRSPVIEIESGEYELTITSKDDPADVLYQSTPTNFIPQIGYLVATFDPDPSITAPISVRAMTQNGITGDLPDVSSLPTLRTFHASIETGAYDLYRDSDFSAPWIANTGYGEVSEEVSTPVDEVTWTFTDAGNVGSILLEQDFGVVNSRRTTRFLIGSATTLLTLAVFDDLRPVEGSAKVRFVQASNNNSVDIYYVEPGTDIADAIPRRFGLTVPNSTGYIEIAADDYEVYLTTPQTSDILAGPVALTLSEGDVVHFVILDNFDPSIVDLVKYEHFQSFN